MVAADILSCSCRAKLTMWPSNSVSRSSERPAHSLYIYSLTFQLVGCVSLKHAIMQPDGFAVIMHYTIIPDYTRSCGADAGSFRYVVLPHQLADLAVVR